MNHFRPALILFFMGIFSLINLMSPLAFAVTNKGIVNVIYESDGFQIEGRHTLYSRDTLFSALKRDLVSQINLKSRLKLQDSERKDLIAIFHHENIRIMEFWVPIAEPPGMVNILAVRNDPPENFTGWYDSKQKR